MHGTVSAGHLSRAAAALLLAASCACFAADSSQRDGIEHRPRPDVPRLGSVPLHGADVGVVHDFDLVGDTLYLLDRIGRVLVAGRRDSSWALLSAFGRSGAGPGEFLTPTGISASRGEIVVIDNTRLQHFTPTGELLSFRSLALPCPMTLAGVAHARTGIFVHGSCARGGYVTDTVKTLLAWSADTNSWQIIAEDLRYTRDGSAGHIFSASNALTPAAEGPHLFGSGATDCVWEIADAVVPPMPNRRCSLVSALYSADPPPQLQARLRSGAVGGVRFEWPLTLPAYVEHTRHDSTIVLVRPYSPDSVVLQLAAPDWRDIAVAPLDGLVGCKAAGCLWLVESVGAMRVIVLDRAALRNLVMQEHGHGT